MCPELPLYPRDPDWGQPGPEAREAERRLRRDLRIIDTSFAVILSLSTILGVWWLFNGV